MPRMPEADDLPTSQGISPGIPKQVRDFVGPALENFGQSIAQAGDRLSAQDKIAQGEEDALDLARARAAWSKGSMELNATYDIGTKPDYGKWGEDYQANVTKVRDGAASLIKNPKLREKFTLETTDDVTRNGLGIVGKAKDYDRGKKLEEAQSGIDSMAAEYLAAPDQPAKNKVVLKANSTIDNLLNAGVIDPSAAIKAKRDFAHRAVKLQLSQEIAENPRAALSRLKGQPGGKLPIITADQAGRVSKGSVEGVNPKLLDRFSATQDAFGKSVPIVSGHRDATTNKNAGGVKGSQHLEGNAIDIDVSGMSIPDRRRLIELASANGITGIGVYRNSLHFDLGARRAWGPSTKRASVPAWAATAILRHESGTVRGVSGRQVRTGADLWDRLIQAESGGDQSAVSPKGARGRAQIMPATAPEAAKLAGLPWDEKLFYGTGADAAAYNEALGKAYFGAKLKEFNGDEAKALAAYNAGAGRVQEAVAKYGDNWLAGMPSETQAYVAKITGGTGGAPVDDYSILSPEDKMTFIASAETEVAKLDKLEMDRMVQAAADEALAKSNGDAKAAKAALDQIEDPLMRAEAQKALDVNVARADRIAKDDLAATKESAYAAVLQAGDDYAKANEVITNSKLPPGDQEWLKKIAIEGPPKKDDQAEYTRLYHMFIADPEGFAGQNIIDSANKLTTKTLLDLKAKQDTLTKAKNGEAGDKVFTTKRAAVSAANDIVKSGLAQIGVVTGSKATPQDAKIAQQITVMAGQRVEKLVDKLGRQPLDSEIDAELKDMWKTVGQKPGWWIFGGSDGMQLDEVLTAYDEAGYDADEAQRTLSANGFRPTIENLLKYKEALDQMKATK